MDRYRSGTGMDARGSVPIQTVPEQFVPVRYRSRCGHGNRLGTSKCHDHDIFTLHQPIRLQHFEPGNEKQLYSKLFYVISKSSGGTKIRE